MKTSKLNLNKQIKLALLAAMAFLLMLFEIQVPIFPSFLKIDLSDLPALIGAFAFGPVEGIIIEFFKNLLFVVFKGTQTALVGEIANFFIGGLLVSTSALIYNINKTRKNAIIGLISGTIVMSLVAGLLNYFVLVPVYAKAFGAPVSAIVGMGSKINSNIKDLSSLVILSIVPFNILKGFVVSIVTLGIYKSVSPIIHKEAFMSKQSFAKKHM
ncbi:ECF transporter S component [Desnuesiella massiliensis]|uniref:ECF transporter S component n=1 Tax=Desnuesiella massiliensis TaxID=1650662 RepID=UPI0006E178BD|nr:ECF transporter S component [Desnuesiella massiliensis]